MMYPFTKKENISGEQLKTKKTNNIKKKKEDEKNGENKNSEKPIAQLAAVREIIAKQHRVKGAKRQKKQTTIARGRGR